MNKSSTLWPDEEMDCVRSIAGALIKSRFKASKLPKFFDMFTDKINPFLSVTIGHSLTKTEFCQDAILASEYDERSAF